ncbi:MaoC/PaaZ C-terminal domain-containing protein [Nocardioides sp.]|uniref:MaoC/PaaZ C-terminal domain-containing protein n=1 Tax=Nocardioides sp. TaxID=35761 RepID=UPI002B267ECC|nr:MaoC/PaaZ C-terminal domain-containing protein [Nocardioides sp.]
MTDSPEARQIEPAGGLGVLLKAALPSVPVVNQLPGVRKTAPKDFQGLALTRPPVTVERTDVDAYARVCGFPIKDVAPLTYPHMLVFGLQMAMMSDPAFPAPAIGTVHLENSITQHRPIAIGEVLDVSAAVGPKVAHPKGTVYEFTAEITDESGVVVWEETSAYLRRGPSSGSGSDSDASYGMTFPAAPAKGLTWKLPADLGRKYAAVSGDHNPIHLYPITAKALGFKQQIAHGMWTKARCVAALENRLPDAVRVDVAFKTPVFLPGSVAFGSAAVENGYAFSLSNPRSGKPHLAGLATPL